MKKYGHLTYRYLKGQKKRTILTILGIVLSVALVTAIGTMLMSIKTKFIDDCIKDKGHYHAKFIRVDKEHINKINNNVDVENIAVTNDVTTAILSNISKEERASDPSSFLYRYLEIKAYDSRALSMFPINIKEGRLPQKENEIIVEYWVPDYLPGKPEIGDKIKLDIGERIVKENNNKNGKDEPKETFNKKGQKEYIIVGTVEPKFSWPGSYITNGITFLDKNKLSEDNKYNVFVKLNSTKDVHEKCKNIAKSIGLKKEKTPEKSYEIKYNEELLRLYAESLNESLNKGLTAVVAFIVGLIIISTIAVIYNIFNISVLERVSQFGILRCTGAAPNQIKKLVLNEALILSVIGIPLGLASGILAMEIVIHVVEMLLKNEIQVVISPIVIIISTIIGLITIYLSAIGPAIKASKISPLEAVRNTGSLKKEKLKKRKRSKIINKILGIEGEIAYKNLKRNRKKFRITVFSLTISIVLYIVFGSFASFVFKMGAVKENDMKDFMLWRNGTSNTAISLSLCNEISNFKDVEKVYKVMKENRAALIPEERVNPKLFEGKPYFKENIKDGQLSLDNNLVCYGDNVLPELKKYLRDGSLDKEKLNNENGVILIKTNNLYNEDTKKSAMVDIVDYKVGDIISIEDRGSFKNGKTKDKNIKKVKVIGVLDKGILDSEYSNYGSLTLITSENVYKSLTGNSDIERMFIQLKEGSDKDNLAQYLKGLNEKDPRYQYVDYREQSKQNRDKAIAINIFLYGFVAVISLIGCLNIVNTISTNLILRKRELAMIRAVGMDKAKMRKMVCIEGMYYGVIASIYGAIIGTALSYKLFTIMSILRDFPWEVPTKEIITAIVGAIIISLMATYIPLKKINRENIIENIRGEE
ncbi:putative ABC transport system permease protein [Clostridium tetanomorphum]|uniref:ABC transporter permease n=1 Tax=Clostridium tetanomorphum TaxID=1553 RepID=UPI00044EDDD1|nr:FtsX-like permease family protein [Clostridium tetanomorphum]KAJ52551.1 permease [Clostridium tetanomorphum DSM 665]MBP1863471.1 putative ABC transport system permease protein [Clostridium tetanomorphum]NRS83568.1 putative ABC transport system permease protein [Clostridium tetanomorphum]SQC01947.1 permease [Clostridium tetanomorphum]